MSETPNVKMSSLEASLRELEELTAKIESGELPVDEAIALYSQGMHKALACRKTLMEMKQKVMQTRAQAGEAMAALNESNGSDDVF